MPDRRPVPDTPAPGQESVWRFPRPAIAEPTTAHLRVLFDGRVLAETRRAVRTLETSHPPSYYFPPDDVDMALLATAGGGSFCEWKGTAHYYDVTGPATRAPRAAWSYARPTAPFAMLRDHIAFYPAAMEACFVNGEPVTPQPGGFYGGWITGGFAGPFKGGPGTQGW